MTEDTAPPTQQAEATLYKSQARLNEITGMDISGTSIFDPVLVELLCRWFSPPGGTVLDPFAGGSVRGIVTRMLGRRYVGVDLSEHQVAANRAQAAVICPDDPPQWICGDSTKIETLAAGVQADFILSCPPYSFLEVYSDKAEDISNMSYEDFMVAYRKIIAAVVRMLKPDRFIGWVVGDFRGKDGYLCRFVDHTNQAFEDAGARLYNDCILITPTGSLPIRTGRQFAGGRKLGRTHQVVQVYCKGNWKIASEACGEL